MVEGSRWGRGGGGGGGWDSQWVRAVMEKDTC